MMTARFFSLAMAAALALPLTRTLTAAPPKSEYEPLPKEENGRWGMYSYDSAKEEAGKKKRPIAIVVLDERSEEEAIKEAGKKAFWGMAKDATMVTMTSHLVGGAKARIGDPAFSGIAAAGKGLPKLVVMDPASTVVIGTMTSEQIMAADEKAFKQFAKDMEAAAKNPKAAPAPAVAPAAPTAAKPGTGAAAAATPPTSTLPAVVMIKAPKPESWTNTDGRAIQASVLEIGADKVVFLMANGSKLDYPLANLSAESQKRVGELKAAASK